MAYMKKDKKKAAGKAAAGKMMKVKKSLKARGAKGIKINPSGARKTRGGR